MTERQEAMQEFRELINRHSEIESKLFAILTDTKDGKDPMAIISQATAAISELTLANRELQSVYSRLMTSFKAGEEKLKALFDEVMRSEYEISLPE